MRAGTGPRPDRSTEGPLVLASRSCIAENGRGPTGLVRAQAVRLHVAV
jgi:hypothetical protein